MTNPEGRPKGLKERKKQENTADRATARTHGELGDLLRKLHFNAGIEMSRAYNKPEKKEEYASLPEIDQEAIFEAFGADDLSSGVMDRETLENALMKLDAAIAIQNGLRLQERRKRVLRSLKGLDEQEATGKARQQGL